MDLFVGREEETEIDIGVELDHVLRRVKRLQKERTELLRSVEKLKDDVEREAKKLEREVSALKEHAMVFRETLRKMCTRRGEATLREVARAHILRFEGT